MESGVNNPELMGGVRKGISRVFSNDGLHNFDGNLREHESCFPSCSLMALYVAIREKPQ